MWNVDFPIAPCRDDSYRAAFMQGLTLMIGIKCLVGHQGIECETINQIWHTNDLAPLAGKQFETDEIAQGIGERQNFGRQSAL